MFKKVYIVGTDPNSGFGGISSSSNNLISGLKKAGVDVHDIVSHASNSKIKKIIFSIFSILRLSNKDALFWIQLGPWVSIIRKLVLIFFIKLLGGSVIVQIHSQSFETYSNSFFMKLLLKILFKMSDKVAVLGLWWESLLHENYDLRSDKVIIIPNFVSFKPVETKKIILTQSTTIKLLSMSRLVKGKGFEQVLALLEHLDSRFHLSIAGDGPLKNDLVEYVKIHDLSDRVTFCGWVNGKEKSKLLATSDIFVLPSTNDSFGMVYIESMMEGTPIVALNYKGVADVINSGNGGILCINSDSQELKKAILKISKHYMRYSESAISHVNENFSDLSVIPMIIRELKIYNE